MGETETAMGTDEAFERDSDPFFLFLFLFLISY